MPTRGREEPRTKPRIAVFAGATATILNSLPLITSNVAARKYGLEPLLGTDGRELRWDVLRPQRLAAPVTVYIEQFSAHPLEEDAADLYASPDGYIGRDDVFREERMSDDDRPVYEVTLRPDDGLYLLPYMARARDGSPWSADAIRPGAPPEEARQPFFPDASRLFEEVDRFFCGEDGVNNQVGSRADFDFYRVVPSGGYTKGLPSSKRTDQASGDIQPETLGRDFFPYRPPHLRREPPPEKLAHLTNVVSDAMASGAYAGGIWLEGSPFVEETAYWLNLLIDTDRPIVCTAGHIGEVAHRNIVDAVTYISSRIWADKEGRDTVGVVGIMEEVIFSARELQKGDDRPGGYMVTGGHGGVVGSMGKPGPPVLTFRPARVHTKGSSVRLSEIPVHVFGTSHANGGGIASVRVQIKDGGGRLLPEAIPKVTIVKHARYQSASRDAGSEVEIVSRLEENLRDRPLAGFVAEGGTPYGHVGPSVDAALTRAVYSGMPVVKVARGNADGIVPAERMRLAIAGNNLTATKARLLLMACLMRFGAVPPAHDPERPTGDETAATEAKLAEFQRVFDSH